METMKKVSDEYRRLFYADLAELSEGVLEENVERWIKESEADLEKLKEKLASHGFVLSVNEIKLKIISSIPVFKMRCVLVEGKHVVIMLDLFRKFADVYLKDGSTRETEIITVFTEWLGFPPVFKYSLKMSSKTAERGEYIGDWKVYTYDNDRDRAKFVMNDDKKIKI